MPQAWQVASCTQRPWSRPSTQSSTRAAARAATSLCHRPTADTPACTYLHGCALPRVPLAVSPSPALHATRLRGHPDAEMLTLFAALAAASPFDYVIVGAGTCGLLLASRLLGSPVDWAYHGVPQPHAAGRALRYSAGKGIGGTSLINSASPPNPGRRVRLTLQAWRTSAATGPSSTPGRSSATPAGTGAPSCPTTSGSSASSRPRPGRSRPARLGGGDLRVGFTPRLHNGSFYESAQVGPRSPRGPRSASPSTTTPPATRAGSPSGRRRSTAPQPALGRGDGLSLARPRQPPQPAPAQRHGLEGLVEAGARGRGLRHRVRQPRRPAAYDARGQGGPKRRRAAHPPHPRALRRWRRAAPAGPGHRAGRRLARRRREHDGPDQRAARPRQPGRAQRYHALRHLRHSSQPLRRRRRRGRPSEAQPAAVGRGAGGAGGRRSSASSASSMPSSSTAAPPSPKS